MAKKIHAANTNLPRLPTAVWHHVIDYSLDRAIKPATFETHDDLADAHQLNNFGLVSKSFRADINTDLCWKIVWDHWKSVRYEAQLLEKGSYVAKKIIPGSDGETTKLYYYASLPNAPWNQPIQMFDLALCPPQIRVLNLSTSNIRLKEGKTVVGGFVDALKETIRTSCRCCRVALLDKNCCLFNYVGDGKGHFFESNKTLTGNETSQILQPQKALRRGPSRKARTEAPASYAESTDLQDEKKLRQDDLDAAAAAASSSSSSSSSVIVVVIENPRPKFGRLRI